MRNAVSMLSHQWTVERWQRQWDKMTADFLCADWINNPAVARCSRWVWCHQHQSDLSLFQLLHDSSVFVIVNLSLLYFIMLFFVFLEYWVSLRPNTLTQIIQNWLAGCQIWNNPFSCLFKNRCQRVSCLARRDHFQFIHVYLKNISYRFIGHFLQTGRPDWTERLSTTSSPHCFGKKVCHVFV